jgi:hypothetical protein
VTEPLDPNEPIPQDKSHLHFGAGSNRGTDRAAARPAHAPAGARRCQALSVHPAARL